jgi:LemA protein
MTGILVFAGLLALLAGVWVVLTTNTFTRARNRVDEAWHDVDVQLRRRHWLVPDLVDALKDSAMHESAPLAAVAQARTAAMTAISGTERRAAEAQLTGALAGLQVVAEEYPELRASESFRALQAELAALEDEIQAARRIYNSTVTTYNTIIQVFPNSMVAGSAYTTRDLFQLDSPAERGVPASAFQSAPPPPRFAL